MGEKRATAGGWQRRWLKWARPERFARQHRSGLRSRLPRVMVAPCRGFMRGIDKTSSRSRNVALIGLIILAKAKIVCNMSVRHYPDSRATILDAALREHARMGFDDWRRGFRVSPDFQCANDPSLHPPATALHKPLKADDLYVLRSSRDACSDVVCGHILGISRACPSAQPRW